jgi:hypothetical protein
MMKGILKDTCIEFFKNEEFREMMKPLFGIIYNEIYLYIWIIAIYNVFLFFGVLGLFIVIFRIQSTIDKRE